MFFMFVCLCVCASQLRAVTHEATHLRDKRQPAPENMQRHRCQGTAVYQDVAAAGGDDAKERAHQGGLARPCTIKRVSLLLVLSFPVQIDFTSATVRIAALPQKASLHYIGESPDLVSCQSVTLVRSMVQNALCESRVCPTQQMQEPVDRLVSNTTAGTSGLGMHGLTTRGRPLKREPHKRRHMPCICAPHHACRSNNQGQKRLASCTAAGSGHCQSSTLCGQSWRRQLLWLRVNGVGPSSGPVLSEFRCAHLGIAGAGTQYGSLWGQPAACIPVRTNKHDSIDWEQQRMADCTRSSQQKSAHLCVQQCLSSLPPVSGRRCP